MQKLKVIHITQSLGGVKTYIDHLFKFSDLNAFDYVIIAPEHFEFQELCKSKHITYHPIKIQRSINPIKDIAALITIVSILKKEHPDIIHTHSAKGGYIGRLAAKFVSAKVIYSPHAFSYLSFKGLKRIIFYALECIATSWTDVLLAVSHSEANRAIYEVGYKSSKVKVILNAIPTDNVIPFRNYKRCINIGMIARLTYQKNPYLFLQVATSLLKKYPDLRFFILGAINGDHLSEKISAYIKRNNLEEQIQILKWGENDTSQKFLQEMDLFLMTSVFEGLPYSLLEAMYNGIPCIVSKVDGNTDVIQNGENGFSCLSALEFSNKVEALIENEELRKEIGMAGHRYIKEMHDVRKNVKALESVYIELAQRVNMLYQNKTNGKVTQEEDQDNFQISSNI